MKIALGIIFSILTAAVIGFGVFFFLQEYRTYHELRDYHTELTGEIASFRKELDGFEDSISPEMVEKKLDSLVQYLTENQPFIAPILAINDSAVTTSHMVISEAIERDLWIQYPFELTLKGPLSSVREALNNVHQELLLLEVESLEANLLDNRVMEFRVSGSVRFPRRNLIEVSSKSVVSASTDQP